MEILSKELLNQNRVLTISNNIKCDYLIVNCKRESTIVMGIKNNTYTNDIIFIKELFNKNCKELVEEVECICREFYVNTILTDKNGAGRGFYDEFIANIDSNNICIRGINGIKQNVIIQLEKDIEQCNIRLMQTYKCAKIEYERAFLGYSEIMNIHRETDKLMNEIDNVEIFTENNGFIHLGLTNRGIGASRFECLMIYYNYKYNYGDSIEAKQTTLSGNQIGNACKSICKRIIVNNEALSESNIELLKLISNLDTVNNKKELLVQSEDISITLDKEQKDDIVIKIK